MTDPVDESTGPVILTAKVAVYYDDGGLEAKAHYATQTDYLAVLAVAAKVYDSLGDDWHVNGPPENAPEYPGPGGVVRVGNVELHVSPRDVMLCVDLDEELRPIHEEGLGAQPRPIHFWTAAFLVRSLANHAMAQNLLALDAERALQHQLAAQAMRPESPLLPPDLRRRLQ